MIPLLALLACAPKQPLEVSSERQEVVCQFAIDAHGRSFAGLMAAVFEGEGVEVAALAPSGTEIFRVRRYGDEVTVTAPDPAWVPWLERLPLHRDLPLVFAWHCPVERCRVAGGTLRQRDLDGGGVERRWRGPGGSHPQG